MAVSFYVHDLDWLSTFPPPQLQPASFLKGDTEAGGETRVWENKYRKMRWERGVWELGEDRRGYKPHSFMILLWLRRWPFPLLLPLTTQSPSPAPRPSPARHTHTHTHTPEETGGDVMADGSPQEYRPGWIPPLLLLFAHFLSNALPPFIHLTPSSCHLPDVGMFLSHCN